MNQKPNQTTLLVDYENVQNIHLSIVKERDINIKIFVGHNQNKIPFKLVQTAQQFGERIEWIKVEGMGSNALDFYIAFYLGQLSNKIEEGTFLILSKDKGFDPLVRYLNKGKIKCKRIETLLEFFQDKEFLAKNTELIAEVIEKISKIQKNKRPRTRKTLHQFVKSQLMKKKIGDQEIEILVSALFVQSKISESNNRLVYNF